MASRAPYIVKKYSYRMYYSCCFVEAYTTPSTRCWACGQELGVMYHQAREKLPKKLHPPPSSANMTSMSFSHLKPDQKSPLP